MTISRERLRQLFGIEEPAIKLLGSTIEDHDGYALERLRLDIGGVEVRGLLARPSKTSGRGPAILYGHSHGGGYAIGADELLEGREYLLSPLGPVFARAGYVTLCIDMPIFGARANVTESAATKALLWHGKSLFGQMLSDQAAALSYLVTRPDVDPQRIGAFGMSMGCTLSYWLGAVDTRLKAVAHLCCYADMRTLIELGAHDGHGIYLLVPGLVAETDAGEIAGLVAPRPQLICVGEDDALTPPLSVSRAYAETLTAYQRAGAESGLRLLAVPKAGHEETPRMREAVLAFLGEHL